MKSRPRDVAIAYVTSGVLHVGVVAAVLTAAASLFVPPNWTPVDTALDRAPAGAERSELLGPDVQPDADEPPINPESKPSEEGLDALAEGDLGDSRLAAFARQKLEQARASAEKKSTDEQLAELESLGRRLNQVSSQESVAAVAEAVAPLMGGSSRATEPAPDTDKDGDTVPFDHATAQIHDVLRHGEDGAFEYVAVMLDAAGQTREVPLDAADGAELYKLFQLMKKYPLMETVYRKAVLGLLDTLMEEQQTSKDESANAQASDQAEVDVGTQFP